MRYGSVCSGIEAATVAWEPMGWKSRFFSEIEKFPSAVLAHHWPSVPNLGDMNKFKEWPDANLDVLVGGTPCQSFSVAGLRKGLDDPRGNLALTYLAIAERYQPRWVVWENVPGVLSSNGGRDFGAFLGGLGKLGYGFAYRVLDAQFFGVAQRRRRVFVVGYLGDWRRAAAVLSERHSMQGHLAPRRETGKGTAGTLASRTTGGGFPGTDEACSGYLQPVAFDTTQITSATNRSQPSSGAPCHPLVAGGHAPAICQTVELRGREGVGTAELGGNTATALRASSGGGDKPHVLTGVADTLTSAWHKSGGAVGGKNEGFINPVFHGLSVRRLTPVECERLQGFPDNHTAITYRGKPAADGPRYKAIGNSMAVPVMAWIGRRIQQVERIAEQKENAA